MIIFVLISQYWTISNFTAIKSWIFLYKHSFLIIFKFYPKWVLRNWNWSIFYSFSWFYGHDEDLLLQCFNYNLNFYVEFSSFLKITYFYIELGLNTQKVKKQRTKLLLNLLKKVNHLIVKWLKDQIVTSNENKKAQYQVMHHLARSLQRTNDIYCLSSVLNYNSKSNIVFQIINYTELLGCVTFVFCMHERVRVCENHRFKQPR